MGSPGKTYPKTRMNDLFNHYGSYANIAKAVGLCTSTVSRIADGNRTHAPTRAKLDKVVKKVRDKKKKPPGNRKFHQLTQDEVDTIQNLHEKFGEQAYKKLGISDSGFELLRKRPVGANVMKTTVAKIAAAKAALGKKPKGWLLTKIMKQQVTPSVDVTQVVTNALVRVEAKLNLSLKNQEKILDQQAQILKFQAEFSTAWLA